MVECSPATRAARVRFPADAKNFFIPLLQNRVFYIALFDPQTWYRPREHYHRPSLARHCNSRCNSSSRVGLIKSKYGQPLETSYIGEGMGGDGGGIAGSLDDIGYIQPPKNCRPRSSRATCPCSAQVRSY